jgi:hypothetical protein
MKVVLQRRRREPDVDAIQIGDDVTEECEAREAAGHARDDRAAHLEVRKCGNLEIAQAGALLHVLGSTCPREGTGR